MELTKDEKEVLKFLIQKQLDEIKVTEKLPDLPFENLGVEIKYGDFLTSLLKKIE